MHAARSFTCGTVGITPNGDEIAINVRVESGEEFPETYDVPDPKRPGKNIRVEVDLEALVEDGTISKDLVLEHVAAHKPDALSRDQLMRLAGVGPYGSGDGDDGDEAEEFDEEEFREGLAELSNKGDLIAWADEFFGLELSGSMSRADMEDAIVDAARPA